MKSPIISIVIANYNYGRFLEDAIRSVISQGVGDAVELIVCDGGSTDNSLEIIKKYSSSIAWWCSEPDKGQSAAFNKGFDHARGRFLTWLNADDVFTNGALKSVLGEIKSHPGAEWFVGSSIWADENLRILRCFCAHRFSDIRAKCAMISVGGPSSFFSRRLYESAGRIDESLHYVMDADLWLRFYFALNVRYVRTRHNVWCYRQHEASKMSGADIGSSDVAVNNRKKALAERDLLRHRYPYAKKSVRIFALIVSYSLIDGLVVIARNFLWRGKCAHEM